MSTKEKIMREICLDIETTGLDPRDGHKIIEIACVEIVDKIRTGKYFHKYINPRREVPMEAFNIHGISTEFLQDKPIFNHIVQEFLEFVGDSNLVIHNAGFDMKFINFELAMLGLDPIYMGKAIDTLQIARKKYPGAQNSLDALCKRFNIDLSKRTKHGALLDTELLVDVYVELCGGLQTNLDLKVIDQTNAATLKTDTYQARTIVKRDFKLSTEEEEAHKKFILENNLNNFWGY